MCFSVTSPSEFFLRASPGGGDQRSEGQASGQGPSLTAPGLHAATPAPAELMSRRVSWSLPPSFRTGVQARVARPGNPFSGGSFGHLSTSSPSRGAVATFSYLEQTGAGPSNTKPEPVGKPVRREHPQSCLGNYSGPPSAPSGI